jgi:tuftelin-interacting protein 11
MLYPRFFQAEVELWNPLTDLTPIHTWLHPWLPPLGARLEIVYPPIRNKLAAALANWHPGKSSLLSLVPIPGGNLFILFQPFWSWVKIHEKRKKKEEI